MPRWPSRSEADSLRRAAGDDEVAGRAWLAAARDRAQRAARHSRCRALALVPVLALLASCASIVPSPSGGAGASVQGRAAPTLADEQRRLAALFQGTPVLFALNADGSLRVEVPLRFCFDPGRAVVKPPLAAVLDRLARSQRDATTRFALTAPLDRGSRDAALAPARSDSVQRYLVERGIAASRFLPAGQTISGWIRIVVAV